MHQKLMLSISKIVQKLILEYSTVYSIIKEYDLCNEHNEQPYSYNNEKKENLKRFKKLLMNLYEIIQNH